MHRIRVYVDTSVFGGTQDEEFAEVSRRFFARVNNKGEYVILLSAETLRELADAPPPVQSIWQQIHPEAIEEVDINNEVNELAQRYINAHVLEPASESDALHVAAATVAGADLILSWNFKHIVNFNRIRGFNSVNVNQGYRPMTILSPLEVVYDDEE